MSPCTKENAAPRKVPSSRRGARRWPCDSESYVDGNRLRVGGSSLPVTGRSFRLRGSSVRVQGRLVRAADCCLRLTKNQQDCQGCRVRVDWYRVALPGCTLRRQVCALSLADCSLSPPVRAERVRGRLVRLSELTVCPVRPAAAPARLSSLPRGMEPSSSRVEFSSFCLRRGAVAVRRVAPRAPR